MRVCQLTWEYPPRLVGGIARHCAGLSAALARKGVEVDVVTLEFPGAPPREIACGVRVHRVPVQIGNKHFLTWVLLFNHLLEGWVARMSQARPFDLIHVHDWLVAPAGIAASAFLHVPLIATMHSTEYGRTQGRMGSDSLTIEGLERELADRAERILVPSRNLQEELVSLYQVSTQKMNIISNGVDPEACRSTLSRASVRRELALPPHMRVILFVGRLCKQKGVDRLIAAFPKILTAATDAFLVIVGDGPERERLEALSARTAKADQILFTGNIPDSVLFGLMRMARVLVMPSIYEPFGIVALEGLLCGVPIVASRIGGLAEILTDGTSGLLVKASDSDALAEGITQVLSDERLSRRFVRRGRQIVLGSYLWDDVAEEVLNVYRHVLDEVAPTIRMRGT